MVSKEEIHRAAQEVMCSDGRTYNIMLEGDMLEVQVNPSGGGDGFLCYLRKEDIMWLSVEHIVALISESLNRRGIVPDR